MGSVHFLELALQNVSRVVWVPGFSFRSALAGQNVNSSGLGIWNFFSLSFIRFFCFLLDSAALSDSWCALILIIALHQYALLYFFSFFFLSLFWCSPLVWWSLFCLNHGCASAGNWLELCVWIQGILSNCVWIQGILPWFAHLQNKLVPCLFVESLTGFSWNLPPSLAGA